MAFGALLWEMEKLSLSNCQIVRHIKSNQNGDVQRMRGEAKTLHNLEKEKRIKDNNSYLVESNSFI